jgi:hypothetical protein
LLVVTAEPINGNRGLALPLPPIGLGRGVTRKTSVNRKLPPAPESKAETGTEIGGKGAASTAERGAPSLPPHGR